MGKLEDSLKMRELTEERFREENPMDERFILLELVCLLVCGSF